MGMTREEIQQLEQEYPANEPITVKATITSVGKGYKQDWKKVTLENLDWSRTVEVQHGNFGIDKSLWDALEIDKVVEVELHDSIPIRKKDGGVFRKEHNNIKKLRFLDSVDDDADGPSDVDVKSLSTDETKPDHESNSYTPNYDMDRAPHPTRTADIHACNMRTAFSHIVAENVSMFLKSDSEDSPEDQVVDSVTEMVQRGMLQLKKRREDWMDDQLTIEDAFN